MAGLEEAIALAVSAHRGQKDKAGQPYILHPLRMMLAVDGEHARMAAVLHDVVEDTEVSLEQLMAEGFPAEVVEAVDGLTRRADESYDEFIERAAANPIARAVKRADLEDNMDVRRLRELGPKELERLARYRRMWERLT
ncbi:MAG: HD domain-containing protein [Vulcanimicrobiota bacterium]